jgi:hypothetical protein
LRGRFNLKFYNIYDFKKEKNKKSDIEDKVEGSAFAENKDNEGSAPEKNADKKDNNK